MTLDDLDAALAANPAEVPTATSTARPRSCRRHDWWAGSVGQFDPPHCLHCGAVKDEARSRRGRQARNYGNRAELDAARRYGGTKTGHHGGPVDIRGVDFDTQMKTRRTAPPAEWKRTIGAMSDGTRCPRLLIRFVQPTGPEDYFVFRADDFLAWFGKDEEAAA